MSLRLSGQNQLSYLGVTPLQPPDLVYMTRDPISGAVMNADYRQFNVGTFWLNHVNNTLWILVKKELNAPLWIQLGVTASGFLQTLTADNAVAVTPFLLNINVVGDSNITTIGNNGTHSVQITLNSTISITNLNVSGNTIVNNLTVNGTLTIPGLSQGVVQSTAGGMLFSSEGTDGQVLIAGGPGFQPVWHNITSGDGTVIITNGAGTIDLSTSGSVVGVGSIAGNDNLAVTGTPTFIKTDHATVKFLKAAANEDLLDFLDAVNSNLVLGSSLISLAGGQFNTGIGAGSLFNVIAGNRNVAYGALSGQAITNGSNNTLIGNNAGGNITTGSSNIALGLSAGLNYTNENNNIVLGNSGTVADSGTMRFGTSGTHTSVFVQGITGAVSNPALVTVNTVTGQLGISSGSGPLNTLTGNTGPAATPSGGNINIKTLNTTVDFDGAAVAHQLTQDFGLSNLLLGATGSIAGASNNVGVGLNALAALTSGSDNTALGAFAADILTTGSRNVAIGFDALDAVTTQNDNVAVGYQSLLHASGSMNTAVGSASANTLTTGINNIAVGRLAGSTWNGGESNNITIGNTGVIGDSGVTRIGTNGLQTSAFMAGVAGVVVANPNVVTINTVTGQLGSQTVPSGGGFTPLFGNFSVNATGGASNFGGGIWPISGTLKNMYFDVANPNTSTINVTGTIRVNGVNTALAITIPALTSGVFSDLVDTVAVTQGDVVDVEFTATSVTASLSGIVSIVFG